MPSPRDNHTEQTAQGFQRGQILWAPSPWTRCFLYFGSSFSYFLPRLSPWKTLQSFPPTHPDLSLLGVLQHDVHGFVTTPIPLPSKSMFNVLCLPWRQSQGQGWQLLTLPPWYGTAQWMLVEGKEDCLPTSLLVFENRIMENSMNSSWVILINSYQQKQMISIFPLKSILEFHFVCNHFWWRQQAHEGLLWGESQEEASWWQPDSKCLPVVSRFTESMHYIFSLDLKTMLWKWAPLAQMSLSPFYHRRNLWFPKSHVLSQSHVTCLKATQPFKHQCGVVPSDLLPGDLPTLAQASQDSTGNMKKHWHLLAEDSRSQTRWPWKILKS